VVQQTVSNDSNFRHASPVADYSGSIARDIVSASFAGQRVLRDLKEGASALESCDELCTYLKGALEGYRAADVRFEGNVFQEVDLLRNLGNSVTSKPSLPLQQLLDLTEAYRGISRLVNDPMAGAPVSPKVHDAAAAVKDALIPELERFLKGHPDPRAISEVVSLEKSSEMVGTLVRDAYVLFGLVSDARHGTREEIIAGTHQRTLSNMRTAIAGLNESLRAIDGDPGLRAAVEPWAAGYLNPGLRDCLKRSDLLALTAIGAENAWARSLSGDKLEPDVRVLAACEKSLGAIQEVCLDLQSRLMKLGMKTSFEG
jgi:hypothetical protein